MEPHYGPPRRILVPVDFSPCSWAAIEYAGFLAERFGSSIDVLHVWRPPSRVEADDTLAQFARTERGRDLDSLLDALEDRGIEQVRARVESGAPAETIVEAALIDHYDLIVVGVHGRTARRRLLSNGVSEKVVRAAPCPVLTVQAPPTRQA